MRFRLLTLWMILGSLAFGAAWEQSVAASGVKAVVSSEKALVVGNNGLNVALSQQNVPMDGAAVEIKAFMPAMPGMPAMESKTNAAASGKGVYKANVSLEMHGTWQLFIYVTAKDGKKYRLKTSVSF